MLEICALASGSNGNCYYIGNDQSAVLVDVGLSARQIQLRMSSRKLSAEKVKAIFISHEHSDHCRGARVLSKRLRIPVFLTKKTYLAIRPAEKPELVRWFEPGQEIEIGNIKVSTFLKKHDAVEACSFRLTYGGKEIGVMTDIGEPCDRVIDHFSKCHAVFLESNYDDDMLQNGPYPYYLKRRVSSSVGHLSNVQALELVQNHAGEQLEMLLLSHLSGENNTPDKALESFKPCNGNYKIVLTSRKEASEVFKFSL
ncbi:MBL fold metallo-hydrolase [Sunxiuqinia sp. A32]|uniref:MBL fold metallo-hydrolase n=1 Tax=Sunxiuqinia sp. A32 TaxID=3461496 RepID=UPI0040467CF7